MYNIFCIFKKVSRAMVEIMQVLVGYGINFYALQWISMLEMKSAYNIPFRYSNCSSKSLDRAT